MALERIKALLQEVIGLHPGSIGDASIERAIHHRMKALGLAAMGARNERIYLRRIQQDKNEFDELVEEVVVPETWFFRNVFPFEALVSYLPGLKHQGAGERKTKILSLPCSTGEEPYSIAMVLMEEALSVGDFSIDAHDVSQRAIRKAKRAIYGQHSFREEYRGLRDRYFQRTRAGYVLDASVKAKVAFSRANIITDDFDHKRSTYDVIFCRNLLIYFDRPTQARVLKKLHRMLKPGGILCVGHAEAAQVTRDYFSPLDFSMAFAFSKVGEGSEIFADAPPPGNRFFMQDGDTLKDLQSTFHDLVGLVEKDRAFGRRLSRAAPAAKAPTALPPPKKKTPAKTRKGQQPADGSGPLEQVSTYLQLGRLKEAATLCENYLKQNPQSETAYYYLGLVGLRQGSVGAAESLLKKALYLDPAHHQALGQLALLAEKRGDAAQAADYRRRQKRAMRRHAGGKE